MAIFPSGSSRWSTTASCGARCAAPRPRCRSAGRSSPAPFSPFRWSAAELIPPLTEGEFFFEVNLPQGASLAATDRVIAELEAAAAEDPRVERNYSRVGSRLVAGGMSLNTTGEHLGQINLVMKDKSHEEVEEAAVNSLRRKFEAIPDVEAKFGRPSYFSLKTPIEVVLYGEDLDVLRDYSLDLSRDLETVPGLVDVRSSLEAGNPELQVVFNRDQLAALHLDLGAMSSTLQDRVQGAVPTRYKEADRQIDVRIRNRESDRQSVDDVENLVLPGPNGAPIRLVSIADVRVDQGPAEIHRLQQQRAAVVSANLVSRSLAAAVRDVRASLSRNPPPQGVSAELAGQQAEMSTSFNSLRFALILAVFLVYLVMAATFESFVHPLIVLFTIPLAIVGVVLGLIVTGTDISVMVLIGVILLVGVVVNNAIVLIDCVNRLRRAGVDKLEAVVRAGHIRLRPILMSTLTTVLGLIPMAISWGEGSELRAPLAITVLLGTFRGNAVDAGRDPGGLPRGAVEGDRRRRPPDRRTRGHDTSRNCHQAARHHADDHREPGRPGHGCAVPPAARLHARHRPAHAVRSLRLPERVADPDRTPDHPACPRRRWAR